VSITPVLVVEEATSGQATTGTQNVLHHPLNTVQLGWGLERDSIRTVSW